MNVMLKEDLQGSLASLVTEPIVIQWEREKVAKLQVTTGKK